MSRYKEVAELAQRLRDGPGRDYNVAYMLQAYAALCKEAADALGRLAAELDLTIADRDSERQVYDATR